MNVPYILLFYFTVELLEFVYVVPVPVQEYKFSVMPYNEVVLCLNFLLFNRSVFLKVSGFVS